MKYVGLLLLIISSIAIQALASETENSKKFTRVVYTSKHWMHPGISKEDLKWFYGGEIYIVPHDGSNIPATPAQISGNVWHNFPAGDTGDVHFVMSKDGLNPASDWDNKVQKWLNEGHSKLGKFDIEGKIGEAKFLDLATPELAPDDTFLIEEFKNAVSTTEEQQIESSAKKLMAEHNETSPELLKDLIKLESLRHKINQKSGKSIIKACFSCGSEGILPRSHKDDWMSSYIDYKQKGDQHKGFGYILDKILKKPDQIISQKMVDIDIEVRMHIVNGKVIPDATFLRFYPETGEYLSDSVKEFLHKSVQEKFLDKLEERLGPDFKNFMACPDVVLTKEGKVKIVDLNAGVGSGFLNLWEDVFTANRLAEAITGRPTPLIKDFSAIEKLAIGDPEKIEMTRAFLKRLSPYIDGHNQDQYWNRIQKNYRELLRKSPTPENFARALIDLENMGLRDGKLFLQFIRHVQDTVKHKDNSPLRLPSGEAMTWTNKIAKLSPELEISNQGSTLLVRLRAKESVSHSTEFGCNALNKIN